MAASITLPIFITGSQAETRPRRGNLVLPASKQVVIMFCILSKKLTEELNSSCAHKLLIRWLFLDKISEARETRVFWSVYRQQLILCGSSPSEND
jgi:hypothetical protein